MRERDIFIEALQKAEPAERSACLDAACAGDERAASTRAATAS